MPPDDPNNDPNNAGAAPEAEGGDADAGGANVPPDPEQQQAAVLEAINAGIAEANGEPPKPPDPQSDTSQQKPGEAGTGAGDATKGGETTGGESVAGKGEGTGGGEAGTGPAAGADAGAGKGKTPDGAPAGAQPPAGETDEQRKARETAERAHIDDPIPDDLPPRTGERMKKLVDTTKRLDKELETATAERDRIRSDHTELFGMIQRTGASPETFAQTMHFLGNLHSDDPGTKRKALEYLQQQTQTLAAELGETPAGHDPLDDHEDLKKAVELGDMKRELAVETAQHRNRAKANEAAERRREQTTAQQTEQQQKFEAAKTALNTLEDEWKAADPEAYARKRTLLGQQISAIARYAPPEKWVDIAREVWKNLPDPGPAAGSPGASGDNGAGTGAAATHQSADDRRRQPMRPSQPAGGTRKEATTMAEAIDAGIAQANS